MGFREDLEHDPISSLQLREAIRVRPETVIRAAVAKMSSHSLGCAVIVDDEGNPCGLFTEQSLLGALVNDVSLDDHCVNEFAEASFEVVKTSEPVSRVWEAIRREGRRFVCVIDDDGNVVGVTGTRGVLEYVSEYFPQQVAVQRLGSKPWMEQREGA